VPEEEGWALIEALAQRAEDVEDRNLPYLLWHGMAFIWQRPALAPLLGTVAENRAGDGLSHGMTEPERLERAFSIARKTAFPQLADWIYWYAATLEGTALDWVARSLDGVEGETLHQRLAGLWLAMEPRANLPMPDSWQVVAPALYAQSSPPVQRLAERLAAVFGDQSSFPRLRATLADANADQEARQHAFAVLSRAQDRESLELFIRLLDEEAFRRQAILLLARFDTPGIASALLQRLSSFSAPELASALEALTSRVDLARALLEAVASSEVPRELLTAHHVRRLNNLNNSRIDRQVEQTWGRIHQTPAEKQAQIERLEKVFNEAPLWAYSARAGHQHFLNLCASCHRLGNEGVRLGPDLTGAGRHGIRYYLENIIDPDAVIGRDFQMSTVETRDGEAHSGLLISETPSALTLRTVVGEVIVPKAEVSQRLLSEHSLMPEGLLEGLNEREQIELLKFLTSN
jgi:putative heme-binding domain-containing protein